MIHLRQKSGEVIRKKPQSPAVGRNDADASSDQSLDGVRIEPITPISTASDQPRHSAAEEPAATPGWTKHLTTRAKVARTLVIALVVIATLAVLLPHPTVTLPPGIARLLTPAPTQTPQPGKFTTGPLEPVSGPPVQTDYSYGLVPSAADPDTAYACLFLTGTEDGRQVFKSAAGQLWITHDAGHTWLQATLPIVIDADCTVSPALDGSHRVTLRIDNITLDQNTQPCTHSKYLLSEDDGATWRLIRHTSIVPATTADGGCELWATSRHLFMWSYTNYENGRAFLERSDDGLTWQRADVGLAGLNANWYPHLLDASGDTLGALVGARPDLWITRDAGATWQRIGTIERDRSIAGSIDDLFGEASLGNWPQMCRCIYTESYPGYLGNSVGRHLFVSQDYTHWSALPPLPVKGTRATPTPGTTATRSGVYQSLGPTADGRLLALGAEPTIGAVATPDRSGEVNGPPLRLWAWNTHTGRWEVAETPVPCVDLQTCNVYSTGASPVTQANGALPGTMFWLTGMQGAGESQPATFATYRLFVPAS